MKWSHFFRIIKYIILTAIIVALVSFFILFSKKTEVKKEVIPIPVVITTPQRKDVSFSLSTYAYVEARSIIPIVPLVNGEIIKHFAKVGDIVRKGEIISILDDEIHALNEQNAKAAYVVASTSFERTQRLFDSGSVSKQVYDEVKGKYEITKGQYELAKTQLKYTTVTSPIGGTIIMNEVSEGSMAQVGQAIAVVSDLQDIVLNITLPSTYWSIIQTHKNDVSIIVEINDKMSDQKRISAKVETISPILNPKDASFTILCAVDEADNQDITVGMYVKVNVVYNTYKNALVIPHSAIINSSNIYTYDEENKMVTLTPLPYFIEHDEYVIVDESLKDEWIVIKGTHLLTDSQIVEATTKIE